MLETGPPLRFMKVMGLASQISLAADPHPRELRLVLALVAERAAMAARQLIHQPEAGVVTRARVVGPGIAETHDELESVASHVRDAGPMNENAAATRNRRRRRHANS